MAEPDPSTPAEHAVSLDDLLALWSEWIERLENRVLDLNHRRQLHDEFMALLDGQDHRDTVVFQDAFHHMYLEAHTIGIRRLVDGDRRTISFKRLLGQLEEHRNEFTRDSYVRRWVDGPAESPKLRDEVDQRFHTTMANRAFDRFSEMGDALSRRVIAQDRDQLDRATERLVQYVDEHVAHLAASPTNDAPTYDEFHRALDHLGGMLQKYRLLIDQVSLAWTTPTIQGDWKGPFRKPLA